MALARNPDVDPYRSDERRVVEYLLEIAPDIGAGDDPIGFLIASHRALRARRPGCAAETPLPNTDLPVIDEPRALATPLRAIDEPRVPRRAPLDGVRLPPGRYHP